MSGSIEFETWWKDAEVRGRIFTVGFQEYAAIVWNAAYAASQLADAQRVNDAYARAKADAYTEIEHKLLAMAGQAFVAGKDDHAHRLRSLVNILFRKPGEFPWV